MKKFLLSAFLLSAYLVSSQPCNPPRISAGPNALSTGGGIDTYRQNCLSYNSDLNAVLWIHRASPDWTFPGYNSGSIQATWMNVSSGVKDSSIIYYDSGAVAMNPARYPGGVFYNPSGNSTISNAYVVGSGPDLVGGTAFAGVWYSTRHLTGTSADQVLPGLDLNYTPSPSPQFGTSMFMNYDMQQVGTKVLVGGELKDTTSSTNSTFNAVNGGIIGKCDFSSGNPVWSYDSITPGYHFSSEGYSSDGSGGRIAFDPSGTIGYWVAQGRLATNYNNSADSMLAPIVYKTTNGGNTWFQVLQGFDWSTAHPELKRNVGFVYNPAGANHFKVNPKHGFDLTVDSTGTLHFVTSLTGVYQDGASADSLSFSYTYDFDHIHHRPLIWDLMTDGTTWNTLLVDSIITSYVAADPATDTTAAYNAWANSATFLAYGARIQVSRSVTGGKVFYSWADSDTNVTGTHFNSTPDLYVKSYDISSQKVTPTFNTTNGMAVCFFHYMADISYFDNGSGKWISPMVYTVGRVSPSPGVYSGTNAVDYYYSDCGGIAGSSYMYPANINPSTTNPCTPTVTFVMHQDSVNPQPGIWEVSAYYSPQVTSAVWNWGDGTSSQGMTPTHTYSAAGQYNICVTVYSACGDSSTSCQNDSLYKNNSSMISVTVLNENGVGIKNNTATADQVSIHPNPSQGVIKLQIMSGVSTDTKAEIYITNVLGEVIYTTKDRITNNTLYKEIDLRNMDNGTYFIRTVIGSKTHYSKFIISR